jgi:hypothetical protein
LLIAGGLEDAARMGRDDRVTPPASPTPLGQEVSA